MVERFNRDSRDLELTVSALDHEAFKSSIFATLDRGNPPDLFSYWAVARVQSIVGQLVPIDSMWDAEGLSKKFAPSLVALASTYDGKKYLLPITQHYVGFYYNIQVFKSAGVEPPRTWTQFLDVCDRLKKAGVAPIALGAKAKWPAQFWFDYLLLRTAPIEYRERLMSGRARYTDAEVMRAFKYWSELSMKGYFTANPNEGDWDRGAAEDVFAGKAGMTLMGTWLSAYLSDAQHRWIGGQDYGFFSFPIIDESIPLVAVGPVDGLIVPNKASHVEGAMRALAHLATEESQQAMSRGSGAFAPNRLVQRQSYSSFQQGILDDMEMSRHWAFAFDLSTPPAVAQIGLDAFAEFLEFPGQYPRTLKEVDRRIRALQAKPTPP